jgi:hypothetical protein
LFLFAAELSIPDPDAGGREVVTVVAQEAEKFQRMRDAEVAAAAAAHSAAVELGS